MVLMPTPIEHLEILECLLIANFRQLKLIPWLGELAA